ncbi:MAG TPA: hypothetical protein VK501_15305 [Baekduia sp.]|uniref:hypothetical protein n=1 Tax=Baekduia sp. TaxID=2600305 RepID=UPI002D069CF8|nr:hypothetical protein [Baekduia sp.]HMJ35276.1 hypothetical protein [Baekduia sp.]
MRRRARLAAGLTCLVVAVGGCGAQSKSSQPGNAPTVSLWTSATSADYRQVNDGARLALAEAGGKAGVFRVNYAARELSDAEPQTTADALAAARLTLQDTQSSAMLTGLGDAPAKAAITLLNEAGIGTVSLGDATLRTAACSSRSDFYPNGRATAVVVNPDAAVPASWASTFRKTYGIAPTVKAFRAYEGAWAILTALAQPGVATTDSPPRLNRDALATALVREQRGCA